MMFSRTRPAALFLGMLFLLAACDPSDGTDVEQAVSDLEKQKLEKVAPPESPPPPPPGSPLPSPGLLAATGLAAKDERAKIVLLLPDTRIAMQEFQRNGLAMLVGRQIGYQLTTSDAAGSSTQQIEQFRQAIAAKPAAIIICPIDPPSVAALIVEAQTHGIIVIGLDKRMLNEGCTSIVFSDQRKVGRMAADTIIEALKRKAAEENRTEITGRVVQLRGTADSYSTNEIAEGFSEGLRTQSGVILVHDAPADWTTENATKCTTEAFNLQKNFDAIYAQSDAMAIGAAKAAETAGQRETVIIVGTDGLSGQKRGLELVRLGELDASVVQPALVDLALHIITKIRSDNTFKPQLSYEIQPVVILPKNVDQMLRTGTYKLPNL
ncbi:substrate-binding domain-containing protein [Prosthecobacter sp.]|uniref:substrate-binding domain-containing protein n=1 Tax=Prosthecobacter sp. TaxID=1965333 RepID=UPI0024875487|nr:substrate-binding domain-containing protein [Prosthecobacter sp.]MDI1315501.1 substrate-binding domain-containing protein [Prosthecobacter sp.]